MLWIVGSGMPVDCLYFYGCGLICTGMAVDFFRYVCGLFALISLRIFLTCIAVIYFLLVSL
jgi:hypothetical protein